LPASPLFPYTTLFRSRVANRIVVGLWGEHLDEPGLSCRGIAGQVAAAGPIVQAIPRWVESVSLGAVERIGSRCVEDACRDARVRSEEHTSELQSPDQL